MKVSETVFVKGGVCWKHSPEHRQHRAAAGRKSILCGGVSSGEPGEKWSSDAAEAQQGRAVTWDEATWFLAGPQSSHQPLQPTDETAADDWQLRSSCCVLSWSWFESDSRWKTSGSHDAERLKNIHVPTNTFRLVVNLVTQTVLCCWRDEMKI